MFPIPADVGRTPCGGGVSEDLTHTALSDLWFSCNTSFRSSAVVILSRGLHVRHQTLLGGLSPLLRDPAAFIEELSHDDHVVAQDNLGHPDPVDIDVL